MKEIIKSTLLCLQYVIILGEDDTGHNLVSSREISFFLLLQLADKFIALFMCPRIVNIDGKPADRLKTAVQQCRDKFQPLVRCSSCAS